MASTIANISKIPELRNRILFTLGLLAVYRAGVFVTTPGVNRSVMSDVVSRQGGFLGLFNLFSGGALETFSVFALGIMPYITASIILQLLAVVVPKLNELKQDSQGRKKITQYTRYGTVLLSTVQGTAMAFYLENLNQDAFPGLLSGTGGSWGFRFITVLSLTTGTAKTSREKSEPDDRRRAAAFDRDPGVPVGQDPARSPSAFAGGARGARTVLRDRLRRRRFAG